MQGTFLENAIDSRYCDSAEQFMEHCMEKSLVPNIIWSKHYGKLFCNNSSKPQELRGHCYLKLYKWEAYRADINDSLKIIQLWVTELNLVTRESATRGLVLVVHIMKN